jgi:hypothetical protein
MATFVKPNLASAAVRDLARFVLGGSIELDEIPLKQRKAVEAEMVEQERRERFAELEHMKRKDLLELAKGIPAIVGEHQMKSADLRAALIEHWRPSEGGG